MPAITTPIIEIKLGHRQVHGCHPWGRRLMVHPDFDMSGNPISTRGGQIMPT